LLVKKGEEYFTFVLKASRIDTDLALSVLAVNVSSSILVFSKNIDIAMANANVLHEKIREAIISMDEQINKK